MKSIVRLVCAFALPATLLGAPMFAASLSKHPSNLAVPPSIALPEGGCGSVTITQSTSQSIVALGSVSCNDGIGHADNSYFRAFDLSAYPLGFDVCSVEFGIETAEAGAPATSQPVVVRLYHGPAGFPAGYPGSYTLLATANLSIANNSLVLGSFPLNASVPAGGVLVMEVFTPDGQAAGNMFFLGANGLGQSAPTYLQAAECGVTTPTPTATIGFPNMHAVMNVVGSPGQQSVIEVPTLGGWGLALLGLFLGASALLLLRRRTA